jgi:anti-sigma B factor antagonist
MARQGGSSMPLNINARERGNVTVLDLGGRIVAGEESDSFRKTIKDLLAANQKKILLNLGEVGRIDSTGIGGLVESVILAAKQGGQLKLVNLPRLIHNVLSTHRLLQAFDIYTNEEEGLASFEKPA